MTDKAAEQFDVVVVGSGAAGAAAALSAHECGARVIVLEKCDRQTAGGNTRVSGGGWFINRDPARAAVFLRSLCGDFPVPDDVIETWAQETAVNSKWMRALGADVRLSPEFHTEPEYIELAGSDCYGGMDTIEGRMGNFLLYDFLAGALTERGIEVRYSAPARELVIRETDGAVIGVEIESDGQRRTIIARCGVVLATGGFEANPQMVQDYLRLAGPALWGSPSATGDGHRMAQKVGADLWHMHNMMTITGIRVDEGAGFYLSLWGANNYLFVGPDGRRFTDESAENRHGHVFRNGRYEHFPVQPMHVIFDENMRTAGPLSPPPEVLPVGWRVLMDGYRWSEDNSVEIEKGWIRSAETLADLAAALGLDTETLERTVDNYNAVCEKGVDEWFGRNPETLAPVTRPPFYAISGPPLLGWSNGGPRRDGRARVLDAFGSPIEGLYAAGTLSSTYSWTKDGGFHIADALAFGRVAGREAAERR